MFNKLKSTFTAPFVWFKQIAKQDDASQKLHKAFGNDKLYRFHGGKHLELGKHLTNTGKIYAFPEVDYYLLNMQQHKGPKAIATVTEGDTVNAGQPLTSMLIKGELPIHSPVNGKVAAITDYLVASMMNKTGPTIVIQNDNATTNKLQPVEITDFSTSGAIGPSFFEPIDYYYSDTIENLRRIKYSGIAGMGGAVFPSARKINNREFITLLINACECEPYITCDDLLMQKYSTNLVEAFVCAQHILKCEQIIVAIEDDKPKAIANLKQAIATKIASLKETLAQIPEFPVEQYCADILESAKRLDFYREKEDSDFKPKPFKGEQATANQQLTSLATSEEEKKQQQELKEQSIELPHEPPYRSVVLAKYRHYFQKYSTKTNNYLRIARTLHALLCIKVRVIPTVYPSGNQRTTIEVLTGMRLTKKQNLTSMGAICFNVMTVYSIYRAITYGEVLTQRLVTLTGEGIAKPGNYWLPFGLTPAVLLDTIGTSSTFTGKVIMGGPMMGFELDDLNVPINKATNCLLFIGESERKAEPKLFGELEEQSCIRCQACQQVCPVDLQPQMMYWYERDKNDDKLNKAHLSSCVECGLCSYVCPSNIPLVAYFQSGKHRIFQKREKERIAAESKIRFEIKSKRDAELKAIEEAKRAESKRKRDERTAAMQAAAKAAGTVDPVILAQLKLQAKGVATGNPVEVTSPASANPSAKPEASTTPPANAVPDNSAIMEQRRLRREAKRREQQEQAQQIEQASASAKSIANNAVKLEATPSSTTDRQAQIASAIALAKAKAKGMAPPEIAPPAKAPEIDPLDINLTDKKAQVTSAIARAKAKAEQNRLAKANGTVKSETTVSTPAPVSPAQPKSAILDVVAKAKAKQQAFLAQQQKLEQEKLEQEKLAQDQNAQTVTANTTVVNTTVANNTVINTTIANSSATEQDTKPVTKTTSQVQTLDNNTKSEVTSNKTLAIVDKAKQLGSAHALDNNQLANSQFTESNLDSVSSLPKAEENSESKPKPKSSLANDHLGKGLNPAKKLAIANAVQRAKQLQAQARQAQQEQQALQVTANSSNPATSQVINKTSSVTNTTLTTNQLVTKSSALNTNSHSNSEVTADLEQPCHPKVSPYGPEDRVEPISNSSLKVQTKDFVVPAETVVEMEVDLEEQESQTKDLKATKTLDKRAAIMAAVAKAKAARALQVQDFLERLDDDNNKEN